jgi:hypothetical protein
MAKKDATTIGAKKQLMRNIILGFCIVFGVFFSYSQNTSYGLALNTSYYDIENSKGIIYDGALAEVPFGIGAFFDYNFKNNLGFKTILTFNTATESYRQIGGNQFRIKQNNLSLTPHFKFDTNGEYNKGFYLFAGPRLTFVLNEKDVRQNAPSSNFYKSTNFGIQLGFGLQFLNLFKFEVFGDYGLSNPLSIEIDSQTAGIIGNILIDIDSLLNK